MQEMAVCLTRLAEHKRHKAGQGVVLVRIAQLRQFAINSRSFAADMPSTTFSVSLLPQSADPTLKPDVQAL